MHLREELRGRGLLTRAITKEQIPVEYVIRVWQKSPAEGRGTRQISASVKGQDSFLGMRLMFSHAILRLEDSREAKGHFRDQSGTMDVYEISWTYPEDPPVEDAAEPAKM